MARSKIWIMLGALVAILLGAVPASAGVAIDNAVMLDPYDPVPPIQFSHWYGGGYACERECGHHCEQSCYHRASCDEGCYRHRDCDESCYRHDDCRDNCYRERCDHDCRPACEHDCRDACDRDCRPACEHDCRDACDRDCRPACEHDCKQDCDDRGCYNDGDRRTEVKAQPCLSGDCYETERWEHRVRDGNHVSEEWLNRGRDQGESDQYRHYSDGDDDERH